jgi:hypothetical protein
VVINSSNKIKRILLRNFSLSKVKFLKVKEGQLFKKMKMLEKEIFLNFKEKIIIKKMVGI